MRTARAAPKRKLRREDLRRGVYYVGPDPETAMCSMWSYSHREQGSGGASVWFFTDCYLPWGEGTPKRFSWGQVERLELLER